MSQAALTVAPTVAILTPDGHAECVASIAVAIAERLGLDERRQRAVAAGALMHDIGKPLLDADVLSKPGPLSDAERRHVERHPAEGERRLTGVFAPTVLAVVRSHHERWDGRGYPDALAGSQIPLEARIVSVADAYQAMREARPYRRALAEDEAVAELKRASGSQFDPRCVDALLEVVANTPQER